MMFLVYAVVLVVYWFCPKYLQLLICVVNLFMPDMIPVVDEVIMVAGLLKSAN